MKNKPKEPPRIAVKFANIVFVLGILYSILLIVYAIYKIYKPSLPEVRVPLAFYVSSMICGGVFATLFGLGLKRLNNNLKVNLSVLFFTIGITFYGFETYLNLEFHRSGDTRTKMEVLNDLRDTGLEILPNILPGAFAKSNGLASKKGRIYPLGTISNSTTIFDNESGYYPIIETDEHGFNNPKGFYIKNNVDIVLTGDSFTEGYSVFSHESISAVLRQLDFNSISVGKAGNGPLVELAALKEYAEPLKPKIVLWLYYGNDLSDLSRDMKSSILRKYLNEDNYSQNLISRQEEIDGVLINYIPVKWKSIREQEKKRGKEKIIEILKLAKLRKMINLKPAIIPAAPTSTSISIFRNILQKSKQMVLGWGGKMYFIYLPTFIRYSTDDELKNNDFVMQTATELDIPIIDIHKEVFDPHPDPLSLFSSLIIARFHHHYTAEGYRLIAEAIGKRLEVDDYVPIKSKK